MRYVTHNRRRPQQLVDALSQVKDLLPNLFVFGKLAVFLLAQAINRREIDGLGGFDFGFAGTRPSMPKAFCPSSEAAQR